MGVALLTPIQSPSASAATRGLTNNVVSTASGKIEVFATATQTFTNTGAALSTAISNGTAKTFYVNNSGSLSLTRFTMTITLPNSSNVASFKRCAVNVAFTAANTCASGTPTTLTNPVSGSATVYVLSLPASGFYSFQITQNKTGTLGVSTTASLTNVVTGVYNS